MHIRADLKCYYCGHVTGQVEGDTTEPVRTRAFYPRPGYAGTLPKPGERIRCSRCGGPVYMDDVEIIRQRPRHRYEDEMAKVPAMAS
jgi:hypothetical protein